MKKEEIIERYGEEEYKRRLAHNSAWSEEHREEAKANNHKGSRKGGKNYAKNIVYQRTGLRGERGRIRATHRNQYRPFKRIIAPDSQIHHEWVPDTSEYRGVALVEANAHQYGNVDVIEILAGEITLRTEEDVKEGGKL